MASQAAAPHLLTFASPDHYALAGGGISIVYLPTGAGGQAHLEYQDSQRTLNFTGDQIRTVHVPDLGTVVSVTLMLTIDAGSTTFSFLLPDVSLRNQLGASAFIRTEGITTVHRFSIIQQFNLGQHEHYTVTPLTGTASLVIIPL